MAPPKLNRLCSIKDCDKRHFTHGFCAMHYKRLQRYGDPLRVAVKQVHGATLLERFNAYVGERGSGCWEWQGYRDPSGYGRLNIGNVPKLAHRISWELHFGSITPEDHILHRCDNPSCVRPEHLFKGDQVANMADKMAKKRHRYGVSRGEEHGCAKVTEDQVREIRASNEDHATLTARYGVARRTIRDIIARRSWKHLP